jgi:hypothetical protein
MAQDLSPEARAAAYSGTSGEAFLTLLDITHPNLGTPIRVVNDMVDITSNGNLYQAFPFDIAIPTEVTARAASASLVINAIDQQIMNAVRSITTPPTITARTILASNPDNTERGPYVMEVSGVDSSDPTRLTLTLIYDRTFYNRCPSPTFSSADFPGLY